MEKLSQYVTTSSVQNSALAGTVVLHRDAAKKLKDFRKKKERLHKMEQQLQGENFMTGLEKGMEDLIGTRIQEVQQEIEMAYISIKHRQQKSSQSSGTHAIIHY